MILCWKYSILSIHIFRYMKVVGILSKFKRAPWWEKKQISNILETNSPTIQMVLNVTNENKMSLITKDINPRAKQFFSDTYYFVFILYTSTGLENTSFLSEKIFEGWNSIKFFSPEFLTALFVTMYFTFRSYDLCVVKKMAKMKPTKLGKNAN